MSNVNGSSGTMDAYILVGHGPRPRSAEALMTAPGARAQVRAIEALRDLKVPHVEIRYFFDYARSVSDLNDLPVLRRLLPEFARSSTSVRLFLSIQHILARATNRAAMIIELGPYEAKIFDVWCGLGGEHLFTRPNQLREDVKALKRTPGYEKLLRKGPSKAGRQQTKRATAISARVRAWKADRFAAQIKDIAKDIEPAAGRDAPTAKQIADEANARGLRTSRGNAWTPSSVQRALTRPEPRAEAPPQPEPRDSIEGSW